jgi:hypothetical protein
MRGRRASRCKLTLLCYFIGSDQGSVTEVKLAVCLLHPKLVLGLSRLKSGAKS